MAGDKRLYLYWDPAIDGDFRRRLERALGGLKVNASDGDTVDPDPDNPGVAMALASASGGWAAPKADIAIQAGPGNFSAATGALRLEASDIDGETQRWSRLVERLRERLGMASLALPPEDLADQLNDATRRAEAAERDIATARLSESNAIRERDRLRLDLRKAQDEASAQAQEIAQLRLMNESGAFALGLVPENLRAHVAEARETARWAEFAAARAAEAAGRLPDAIAWGGSASYSGEHRNGRPDGPGVMTFGEASFRGEFANGKRSGLGIGVSEDGLVWSGQWRDDEACGYGILEAPDGRRFEGEVKPDSGGAPKATDHGWMWQAPRAARPNTVHHPAPLTLPPPQAD
jgi:hypothetical protein